MCVNLYLHLCKLLLQGIAVKNLKICHGGTQKKQEKDKNKRFSNALEGICVYFRVFFVSKHHYGKSYDFEY